MRKWILITFTLFAWIQVCDAQDLVGCQQLFEDAKEAYAAGMVELVPELLVPCLEDGLVGESRKEAYKLVINAYLFDYMPEMADSLMAGFLKEYPTYRPVPSDPAEFVLLLRSKRADNPEIQQLLFEEERIAAEKAAFDEKERLRRELPPGAGEAMSALGFIAGSSATFPRVIEPYSTGDPSTVESGFGMSFPGIILGGSFSAPLTPGIELDFELLFNRTRFNYTSTPFSFATYKYDEYQSRFQVPVSVNFIMNQGQRFNLYMRLGMLPDYMLSASATGTRSYTETGSANPGDVVLEKTEITRSRKRLNLNAMAGIGMRRHMPNSYFFVEARYNVGLFMSGRTENRYENQDLIWLIYHVDSDFRINQLTLTAGLAWKLK